MQIHRLPYTYESFSQAVSQLNICCFVCVCISGWRGQLSPMNHYQTQVICDCSAANFRVEGKCTVQFNYMMEKAGWKCTYPSEESVLLLVKGLFQRQSISLQDKIRKTQYLN